MPRPGACSAAASEASPFWVSLPSPVASGIPVNDRIWLMFQPAWGATDRRSPAIVLLHPLGEGRLKIERHFARYLARQSIACAVMVLPYHMFRSLKGEQPLDRFASGDVDRLVQAANQSAADVSAVVTWLSQHESVDPQRIGVIGISLGAILEHLAMGKDDRLGAGVAILGGGNLLDLRRKSLVFKLRDDYTRRYPEPAAIERLRTVDPLTYSDRNRPRRVLMIQAARDLIMPPRDARELWEALGRPPIRWVDTNHFGLGLSPKSVMRASVVYLRSVWEGRADRAAAVPRVHAITLKLGMLFGLDSRVDPALQWQALSLATRPDHMSLLHLDLGWSGRGPFIGVAATLNAFMDVGVAHRLNGDAFRPYASLHIVF